MREFCRLKVIFLTNGERWVIQYIVVEPWSGDDFPKYDIKPKSNEKNIDKFNYIKIVGFLNSAKKQNKTKKNPPQ